jgi:adenylate cyclase
MTPSEAELGGAKILLIEDDTRVVRAMSRFLEIYGGQVFSLSRVAEVMPWLAEHSPDIVVLDFHLPDGDGLALCAQIRALPSPPPVVVITGDDDVQRRAEALSRGADDLLLKPPHPHNHHPRLTNVLRRYRAEAQNRQLIARLESYVSTAAAQHLLGPDTSERIDAILLFSDLRGFTAASFTQDAAQVFDQVNLVLTTQSRIIREHGGYVDGFSGDGLLALFEGDAAAAAACRAAATIIRWARSTSLGSWEQLPVGMGIHRGVVIRGDLGDDTRRVFTVLGSPVNIAARLCGAAAALETVVSEAIVTTVGDEAGFCSPREVMLRGLPAPLRILSLSPDHWT